jgi:hypothetical protein
MNPTYKNTNTYQRTIDKNKKNTKKIKLDLKNKEGFNQFLSNYEFIDFKNYQLLAIHLEKIHGTLTKSRITKNLNKLKLNKGRNETFTSEQFISSVEAFIKQTEYEGIFVVDVKKSSIQNKKSNGVDDLKPMQQQKISDADLDAELAKYGVV